MAGNRQHILPRFLLKGFASRIEGEKTYTWVYPRNHPPVEANIRKVGAERHFYGKQGELSVDDDITEFEGEYAPLFEELRKNRISYELSDKRIANFVTHLVIRTKNFRESFRESSEFMIEKMSAYFSDFSNIKSIMSGKYAKEELEKRLKENKLPRYFRRKSKKLLKGILPTILDSNKAEMLMSYEIAFQNIKNSLPRMIKDGHIKGLSKDLTPEPRVNDYQLLKWFIYYCEGPIILGDMGCLFEISDSDRFRFITFENDIIKNIFLPISYNQILIGTSDFEIPHVDLVILNKEIARHSRDFFIASVNSKEISSLVSYIGCDTELISKQEIENMAKEIFSRYEAT